MKWRSVNICFLLCIACFCSSQENDLIPFLKKGKWGFADTSGKIVIGPEYTWVGFFSEGMACVQKNGLFGFVNEKGKKIIDTKYISPADFKGGIVEVSDGNEKFIFDRRGEVIISLQVKTTIEKKFRKKFGDIFSVYRFLTSGFIIAEKDTVFKNTESKKLLALLDRKGNFIIPRHEWTISPFTNNLFCAKSGKASYVYDTDGNIVLKDIVHLTTKENGDLVIRTKSGLDYLDSAKGKIIALKTDYFDVNKIADRFFVFTVNRNTKQYFGIANHEGNELVPGKNTFIGKFSENKFIARDARGFYGAYDTSGRSVVPFEYEFLERFSEGLALAKMSGNWFYINEKGKQVVKSDGDYKRGITEEIEPEQITTYVNGELYCFKEGLAVFFRNGKAGYLNHDGKIVIEPIYDFAEPFKNGLAKVYVNADGSANFSASKKISRIIIDKEGRQITTFTKTLSDFSKPDYLDLFGATFINSGEGWKMRNEKGVSIENVDIKNVYPDIISNGKFIRVATRSQKELFIRSDGRMFVEE